MSEDTNKITGGEAPENEEKAWDWDASVPEVPTDSFDIVELSNNLDGEEQTAQQTDDITEEADENQASVQEPEPDKEEDEHEEGTCLICGKDLRKSPSDLYCNNCREKYLKVSFGASHIILSIIMVFACVFGIFLFVSTSQIVSPLLNGKKQAEQNLISNAVDSYNSVADKVSSLNDGVNAFIQGISTNFKSVTLFESGTQVNKELARLAVKTVTSAYTDREYFINLVEKSFTEAELNKKQNAQIKECYEFCKHMDTTANDMYENWYSMLEEFMNAYDESGKLVDKEAPTPKDIVKYLEDFEAKNPTAEKSTIEYYKFMTLYYDYVYHDNFAKDEMLTYMKDAYSDAGKYGYFYSNNYIGFLWECEEYDELLKILEEAYEVNPSNENAFIFAAKTHLAKGQYEQAVEACDMLKKYNPDSLTYYSIKAEALRRSGDFNAAVDVCSDGEKKGSDPEILRQKAIAYMLLDEKDNALEAAKSSYESTIAMSYSGDGSISIEILNTTALICKLCGDDTTYDEIKSMLEKDEYEFEEETKSVIKGDKTFEDLFMSGKGDI